jgi:hypothetical protein
MPSSADRVGRPRPNRGGDLFRTVFRGVVSGLAAGDGWLAEGTYSNYAVFRMPVSHLPR